MRTVPTYRVAAVAVLIPYILVVPPLVAVRAWLEADVSIASSETPDDVDTTRSFFQERALAAGTSRDGS